MNDTNSDAAEANAAHLNPEPQTTAERITLGGLSDLTGSESDIARAASIRLRLLSEADDLMEQMRSNQILTDEQADTAVHAPQQVTHTEVKMREMALHRLQHQTDAAWWLTQEHANIETLLR